MKDKASALCQGCRYYQYDDYEAPARDEACLIGLKLGVEECDSYKALSITRSADFLGDIYKIDTMWFCTILTLGHNPYFDLLSEYDYFWWLAWALYDTETVERLEGGYEIGTKAQEFVFYDTLWDFWKEATAKQREELVNWT